jgi:katanin p80 WD40 repeat-containing subunit B1
MLLTNVVTGNRFDLSGHELTCVAFFPTSDSFVAANSNGLVSLWSAKTGTSAGILHTHGDVVRSVAVSPHGKIVAVGGKNGSVTLIDVESKEIRNEFSVAESAVNCVRFSPDGRRLAVAVGDWTSVKPGQVTIWNLATQQAEIVLPCESAPGAVSFVSMDEMIVGQWDGHTSLWNLATHRVVGTAAANKEIVTAASFSPDNPVLREVVFLPADRTAEVSPNDSRNESAE